ncbi:MAG: GFA family protein [Phycisphaerales bacterium]|nr:GFA family protein [Hyphomonadaceae bacterium]
MVEGGCHCGALRYALAAAPVGSMICHCRSCLRITGAPVVAWLTVASDAFAITKGEPARYASSPKVDRRFCGVCGTHVAYTTTDDPDYFEVATGTLDEPNAFPPTHHSWLSHDLNWVEFGDGLPTFQKSRGEG